MMYIWEVLTHTPWWVFVLFFYLLKVGIDATKPRTVILKKLFILPSIFLGISINTLFKSFDLSFSTLGMYLSSLILGIMIGLLLIKNLQIKFDRDHNLIRLPGTFSTLILILITFSTKYYFGYLLSTAPSIAKNPLFIISQLGMSGVCSGLFIGRLICFLFRKSYAIHEPLK